MTRKEFVLKHEEDCHNYFDEYYSQYIEEFLSEIYDDFEQQLADMQKRIDELEAINGQLERNTEAEMNAIINLKKRIDELVEPKSCDGCKYLTQYGCNVCAVCERHEKCIDRYEPKKDKQ